jgi:methylenetetrahydrofolate dehydrogenase (NADP+)/methenyltetrahydrofolate cyclohydrolase
MSLILDGRATARALASGLRERVARLSRAPGLAVVLVGEDPASQVYVRYKQRRAERLGFTGGTHRLAADTSQVQVEALVDQLNGDDSVDGILVQLPLPAHIDSAAILARIRPDKDVDGFHVVNSGHLCQGRPSLVPCTPLGVMRMLAHFDISLSGMDAVVLGRSNIVGRPMAMLLEQANATVTVCHSRTRNVQAHLKRADLVVAAVGRPKMLGTESIRDGAVVVDVGINRLADGSLCGDVDFDAVSAQCRAITPVPGGVGPMTIAMLMENTITASERRQGGGDER